MQTKEQTMSKAEMTEYAEMLKELVADLKADNDRAERRIEAERRVMELENEYERHIACDDWPDDADQSPEAKAKRRKLHYRGTIRLANMLAAMADMRKELP
jgi:hypothetical protein